MNLVFPEEGTHDLDLLTLYVDTLQAETCMLLQCVYSGEEGDVCGGGGGGRGAQGHCELRL